MLLSQDFLREKSILLSVLLILLVISPKQASAKEKSHDERGGQNSGLQGVKNQGGLQQLDADTHPLMDGFAHPQNFNSFDEANYQSSLGAYFWQKGDYLRAIDAWSKEAEIYQERGLIDQQADATIKIAQTYLNLGQLTLATFELNKVLSLTNTDERVEKNSFYEILAKTQSLLGDVYFEIGDLDKAEEAYKKSLELSRQLSVLNSLVEIILQKVGLAQLKVNTAKKGQETEIIKAESRLYRQKADKYAALALELSQNEESIHSVEALIHWAKLSPTGLTTEQRSRGRKLLLKLPRSRVTIFTLINWAKLDSSQTSKWLSMASLMAEDIGDTLAQSYALVELGLWSEKTGNIKTALLYAQKAELLAQSRFAYSSLYQAQWLAARIYRVNGNINSALSYYSMAIASYDSSVTGSEYIRAERRLNFTREIEPMYREMLQLLLNEDRSKSSDLESALFIFDKLRLAQLQNYFGDGCFEVERQVLPISENLIDEKAVAYYSIILEDQTHFILSLADGTYFHHVVDSGRTEISELGRKWYFNLQNSASRKLLTQSRQLYDIIIRPVEKQLQQINPETIVFIHDGILRNLPMAALYDGEQFLAEKWASVSSIGLNFKQNSQAFFSSSTAAFGLGVKIGDWSLLEQVPKEIKSVADITGGEQFLNEQFSSDSFQLNLSTTNYLVVHVATHGYFGGVAENSLILAYNRSVYALQLKDILSESKGNINMLVLSACETAIGSELSALGIAGIALRSGVDSVLGTFWAVQDVEQPELIKDFYTNIYVHNLDKAKALQQLQIKQIQEKTHPAFWAAFNLIGDYQQIDHLLATTISQEL
ncbi:MAG: CHAT domain-containing protein [Xenococcaceae cyanobacterium MO_167.B27]|nr:CHAT domain-containing protein [Xenococcaceae cyanobacterium MO_167.B27]